MRGLEKSKRISWATDGNLCQVRLFLSEDCPSQVGLGTQDHLQPKKKQAFLYNTGSVPVPDESLPPGFEGTNPRTQLLKNKLAHLPLAKWKCPPRLKLNASWRVTAGEESNEVETQNQRELRVLEAIYPRASSIPPSPVISLDAENTICDDSSTPLIPITPIEEEDSSEDVSNVSTSSIGPCPPGFAHGVLPSPPYAPASVPKPLKNGSSEEFVQPQLLAAASAALSSLVSGIGGQERLIDHNLLAKILNNPAVLEDFVKRQVNPSSSKDTPISSQPSSIAPNPPAPVLPISNPPPTHFSQMENPAIPSSTMKSSVPPVHYQPPPPPMIPSTAQSSSSLHAGIAPPPKDINYYKSLIQQHGGERQQEASPPLAGHHGVSTPNPEPVDTTRPIREPKFKVMKPCIYFHSSKGCRRGANCAYQHDGSGSLPEMGAYKRMKMTREMRGTQPYS